MVQLHDSLSDTDKFELIAFPCNQFDEQEPRGRDEIKEFVEKRGVNFRMMETINVNGQSTHDVYRYLKSVAGPAEIEWNFATYYVINMEGKVEALSDVTPLELRDTLDHYFED